jgi:hypothetical protein
MMPAPGPTPFNPAQLIEQFVAVVELEQNITDADFCNDDAVNRSTTEECE